MNLKLICVNEKQTLLNKNVYVFQTTKFSGRKRKLMKNIQCFAVSKQNVSFFTS